MSEAVLFSGNPYGYGAKTLEQIHRYLTRAVSGVCFATDEEQQAAQWLKEMQDKIKLLEDEVKLLYEKHKNSNNLHGSNFGFNCDKYPATYCSFFGICDYGFLFTLLLGTCALSG
jgi:hypothetical protein